jgi:hypothetical protein
MGCYLPLVVYWVDPETFQMLPYYLKVSEYSDMENRDIWEYHLNLNVQIDQMLMHIWEVGRLILIIIFSMRIAYLLSWKWRGRA